MTEINVTQAMFSAMSLIVRVKVARATCSIGQHFRWKRQRSQSHKSLICSSM